MKTKSILSDEILRSEQSALTTNKTDLLSGSIQIKHEIEEPEVIELSEDEQEDPNTSNTLVQPKIEFIITELNSDFNMETHQSSNSSIQTEGLSLGENSTNDSCMKQSDPYKCQYCLRSFKFKKVLENHIKTAHLKRRPYSCKVCGKTFTQASHRNNHEIVHTADRPFACHICKKGFRRSINLKVHVDSVHLNIKRFKCETCQLLKKPSAFETKRTLMNHMLRTHGLEMND